MSNPKTSHAFAVFEPAVEGGFNVSFPSFPGCVTFGRTLNEAQVKAAEVLELWIEELKSQKQKISSQLEHFWIS